MGVCLWLWVQPALAAIPSDAGAHQTTAFAAAAVVEPASTTQGATWAVAPMQTVTDTESVQTPVPTVPITNPIGITSTITLTDLSETDAEDAVDAPVDANGEQDGAAEPQVEDEATDEAPADAPAEPQAPAVPEPAPPLDESQLDALYADTLEGTIIANRTTANVTFFVEGELYRLAPLRSFGLDLPRENSVLNLYNCDADTPQTEAGCFWDPYVIRADGFYEIFNDAPEGLPVRLVLAEAGAPPTDQVWVQNRTGQREVLVYGGETHEIAPSAIVEFDVGDSPVVTFYRRSCLALNGETVCEWAPETVEPGFYYALDEVVTDGGPPNSQIIQVNMEPVLGEEGATVVADEERTPVQSAPQSQLVCQLQVPVLNVRSGPGLEYLVISQIRTDGQEPVTVPVVGRDAGGQWLAVDESVAEGGWITASEQFVQCNGDISELPIAEVTDGRLEPTPEPPAVTEAPAEADAPAADGEPADAGDEESAVDEELAEEDGEAPEVEVPEGQALLIVNNTFEHEVRFTIAPDEYDLQPGETIYVVVNPGRVQFSVSSAWRGISGNAEFVIEPDQSETLWLYFVPDPADSDEWELRYQ
jgi:hypothetical protein